MSAEQEAESLRSCGHLKVHFEGVVLRCAQFGCRRRPRFVVVYVGLSIGDRLCWRINGSCWRHLGRERREAVEHREPEYPVTTLRVGLSAAVDWIHDGGRCEVDWISVTDPGAVLGDGPPS